MKNLIADSAFTERVLGSPAENFKGYVEADLTQRARLVPSHSLYLLHGMADLSAPYTHGMILAKSLTENGIIFRYQVNLIYCNQFSGHLVDKIYQRAGKIYFTFKNTVLPTEQRSLEYCIKHQISGDLKLKDFGDKIMVGNDSLWVESEYRSVKQVKLALDSKILLLCKISGFYVEKISCFRTMRTRVTLLTESWSTPIIPWRTTSPSASPWTPPSASDLSMSS